MNDALGTSHIPLSLAAVRARVDQGPHVPLRPGHSRGSIVADDCRYVNDDENVRYYGGNVVAESAWGSADAIIAAYNALPQLLEALEPLVKLRDTLAAGYSNCSPEDIAEEVCRALRDIV